MSSYLPMHRGSICSISEELAGSALDAAVRTLFGLTWGRARELVRRGKIAVDGQTITNPITRVRKGATIAFDPAARGPLPNDLADGALVFADSHLVVVDKPAGVSTVPFDPDGMGASIAKRTQPGDKATLIERVRALLARRERSPRSVPPSLGVVHRLDKETSGLIVFTRSWVAKKNLMQAFRAHTIDRRYFAIVMGEARGGTFRSHFVANRGDGLRGSVEQRHGRQKPIGSEKTQLAITHVEIMAHLPGTVAGQPCTLVSCRLETGRTHQIRIHLAESGHPVLGDRVYSRDYVRAYGDGVMIAPRLMLHAGELGLVHPATERAMRWTSPLPEDMEQMLDSLKR
ncbi:MAG: RluA family pseudouridine synthase [Polyangiaceae bacterium]|nr:RluA family pseudouridine synthase [Polyangiaceae bacterium]